MLNKLFPLGINVAPTTVGYAFWSILLYVTGSIPAKSTVMLFTTFSGDLFTVTLKTNLYWSFTELLLKVKYVPDVVLNLNL